MKVVGVGVVMEVVLDMLVDKEVEKDPVIKERSEENFEEM